MQGFFCVCKWNIIYDTETLCLNHLRAYHPQVQRALIVIRRSIDPFEYDQINLPSNSIIKPEQIKDIKTRLCKLATVRKRLPLLKEERDEIQKRRMSRIDHLKSVTDNERTTLDKKDMGMVAQQRLMQATRQAQACKGGM